MNKDPGGSGGGDDVCVCAVHKWSAFQVHFMCSGNTNQECFHPGNVAERGAHIQKTITMSTERQPLQKYNYDFLITMKKF